MSLQAKWVHTLRTEYRRTCRASGADSIHAQNALRYLQREAAHLISGAYCVEQWAV